jgi:hypothetical protein
MAGVPKTRIGHDDVYEAVATIPGGRLVVPADGATNPGKQGIDLAGDAAVDVLGVASRLAQPTPEVVESETDADGYPSLAVSPVNELVTVYKRCVLKVEYTDDGAIDFGAKLAAAADGMVRLWVTGDGAAAMVGECRVVGGMSADGGVGLAYIY